MYERDRQNKFFYMIAVDLSKNRLYNLAKGPWVRPAKGDPNLLDLEKALKQVKKGFTALNNTTTVNVISQEWAGVLTKARQMLIEAGISKSAEVLAESAILKMQVQRVSRQAGFTTKIFSDVKDAEAWLDEGK